MLSFGMFIVTFIGIVVAIINLNNNKITIISKRSIIK
ncbi:putative holin-like toxin [Staphylococcus schweitzeri]